MYEEEWHEERMMAADNPFLSGFKQSNLDLVEDHGPDGQLEDTEDNIHLDSGGSATTCLGNEEEEGEAMLAEDNPFVNKFEHDHLQHTVVLGHDDLPGDD